jgi:Ribbon-helix-helix protein, copG family
MKRLQIRLDEETDEILATEAARRKTSRATVIRELIRENLADRRAPDPMAELIGDIDDVGCDIDEVVYSG